MTAFRSSGNAPAHRFAYRNALGIGGAIWAIVGVAGILGWAIVRLSDIALGALEEPLAWYHWAAIGAFVPFMVWSEGLRGFQRRFSPRVAERAMLIRAAPTAARVIFAPLFAAGFFGGPRRDQVRACLGTVAIIVLVILVHRLEQPWRGILDAGVVAGLTWGGGGDRRAQRAGMADRRVRRRPARLRSARSRSGAAGDRAGRVSVWSRTVHAESRSLPP